MPGAITSGTGFCWETANNVSALLDKPVPRDEVKAADRKRGVGDLTNIAAVVLETDRGLSVITRNAAGMGQRCQVSEQIL
jgi:hypothetical protein